MTQWYQEREGKSLINFGATVSHGRARAQVVQASGTLDQALTAQDTLVFRNPWSYRRATPEQITQLQTLVAPKLISDFPSRSWYHWVTGQAPPSSSRAVVTPSSAANR